MDLFGGKTLFLDRDDINTDEIIPAKYLTEITKEALAPHLLEDLKLGNTAETSFRGIGAVVGRANFGCGSSREHAPWAFQVNGIQLIIARNFARIFRQNIYNSGMLAVELPEKDIDTLFRMATQAKRPMKITADPGRLLLRACCDKEKVVFSFKLNLFQQQLVQAGGWVNYARNHY